PPRRRRGARHVCPTRGGRARARGAQCRPCHRHGWRGRGRCAMTIRPAVFADVPGLRRLYTALQAELAAAYPVPYPGHASEDLESFTLLAARRLEQDPTLLFYVAVDDDTGELLGFLGGEISERAIGEPRVFGAAHWLYIVPDARGRGLARGLPARGVAAWGALGVTPVETGPLPGNTQGPPGGWPPYLAPHVFPLAAVRAGVAERPAVAQPPSAAPTAPAPVEPPARK